jgi:hypothetical protein
MSAVTLEIYDEFPYDVVHRLTPKARSEVKSLLAALQSNPYDPSLQRRCRLHEGGLFEYPLDGGFSIYWRVREANISVTDVAGMTVWLVKIAASSKVGTPQP